MTEVSTEQAPKNRRTEFDDALRGYYTDHDEVRQDENPDYRSLTAESVGSLILGFLSILTFISVIFLIFPIMGIVLGVLAIRKILGATEELSGLGISSAGVALCTVLALSGIAYQMYAFSFETPPGYERIDFSQLSADPLTGKIADDILLRSATRDPGGNIIPLVPRANPEENLLPPPPVFIEGYMFATRQMSGIDSFVLVPALEQSRFGGITRNPTEMVEVRLLGGITATYQTTPVRVGGYLFVNENYASGELPYRIEADVLR